MREASASATAERPTETQLPQVSAESSPLVARRSDPHGAASASPRHCRATSAARAIDGATLGPPIPCRERCPDARRPLIVLAAALLTAGAAVAPAGSASAAPCLAAGCTGLDPSATGTGCNSDATYGQWTQYRTSYKATAPLSTNTVNLRHSSNCRAFWANILMYEFPGTPATLVLERGKWVGSTFMVSSRQTSPLVYGRGAYTAMIGGSYAEYRACIVTSARTTCTRSWDGTDTWAD